jgi:hypothetical protein
MNDTLTAPKVWTKEEIKANLVASDKWLMRGLISIYNYQTAQEQSAQQTVEENGIGFNGCDGTFLSSLAEQAKTRGTLSPKQTVMARKAMLKYASQLAKVANRKQ